VLTSRLEFDGRDLELGETTVVCEVDDQRRVVHVQVHNPAYRKLRDELDVIRAWVATAGGTVSDSADPGWRRVRDYH
jgi:hypothetical protein